MPNIQPLRARFSPPQGRIELMQKQCRPGWFDGREMKVAVLCRPADPAGTIVLSVTGPAGDFHLPLSGGEAARLMFEIGYALEQAAGAARLRCNA